MPEYKWVAETKKGKTIRGELEAADEKLARLQLKRRNLKIKKLKEKPKDLFANVSFMQPKITSKDLVIFTRQFSTMIDAGLPLVQGLTILADQMENKTFKGILKEVVTDVEGGASLAEALQKHPKVFDNLFVNLVAAGEVGGILDTILQRLATHIEKAQKLKSKIKSAMTYPAIVVAVAILVISVIMIFVIPVFESMFADFGSALPLPHPDRGKHQSLYEGECTLRDRGCYCPGYCFQEIQEHQGGAEICGYPGTETPRIWATAKESRCGQFHQNPGNHDCQRCSDYHSHGNCGQDVR